MRNHVSGCGALPDAARDLLVQEIDRAQKHAREALIELGHTLDRVKGICHWLQRDVQTFDWCAERLQEAREILAPLPPVETTLSAPEPTEDGFPFRQL